MEKRGQVSIFIVIGIIIVVLIGVFYYIGSSQIERPEVVGFNVGPVEEFVEDCVVNEVLDGFRKVYENSGRLDGGIVNICRPGPQYYELKEDIEESMGDYLEREIDCDLSDFDLGNLDVRDVEIVIKDKEVLVDLDVKDVVIIRGDNEVRINKFNVEVPLRFGEIYGWVGKIRENIEAINEKWNTYLSEARSDKISLRRLPKNTIYTYGVQDMVGVRENEEGNIFKFDC